MAEGEKVGLLGVEKSYNIIVKKVRSKKLLRRRRCRRI
jgi:hypothetical protein